MSPLGIVLIIVLLLWIGGYFGYGRARWHPGAFGDVLWLCVVVLLVLLLARALGIGI